MVWKANFGSVRLVFCTGGGIGWTFVPLPCAGSTVNTHNAVLIFYPQLMELKSDFPLGGGTNVPPVDNQVTMGHPVAPKVYFQAPGCRSGVTASRNALLVNFLYGTFCTAFFCFKEQHFYSHCLKPALLLFMSFLCQWNVTRYHLSLVYILCFWHQIQPNTSNLSSDQMCCLLSLRFTVIEHFYRLRSIHEI